MYKQVRTDLLQDIRVKVDDKPPKFYEQFGVSHWFHIPENFIEFFQLCKQKKDQFDSFEIEENTIIINKFSFKATGERKGEIWLHYENINIFSNVSVAQMWNFVHIILYTQEKRKWKIG